jgi:tetratricopeptide (TPR) repeat protein
LIYAGHNEWYGALGVGSTEALGSRPVLVRLSLALQRWRTFMAIRRGVVWVRRKAGDPRAQRETPSFMETLARDREIALGGPAYERGLRQYAENLEVLIETFRDENVPVLLASLASNVRDQKPFASPANAAPGGADSVFADAQRLLAQGDSARARVQYYRARDLDVVRFRAPTAFDSIARDASRRGGATYVPVSEGFASAAPAGLPGRELFLEHVHPTAMGYALIARTFFQSLRDANVARALDTSRVRPWPEYERGRWLTPFDLAIAQHTHNTLALRWPFVAPADQRDYRASYRPRDFVDSLAFMVSRGEPWELAKLSVAQHYERRGALDSAIAEYRGLARDAPLFETPHRLLGRALVMAGRVDEAETPLRRALAIAPTAAAAHALAVIVLRRRSIEEGIRLLELALRLEPDRPDALYQLAVARGMAQDVTGARSVALRLARVAPTHPGLPGLLKALGLSP